MEDGSPYDWIFPGAKIYRHLSNLRFNKYRNVISQRGLVFTWIFNLILATS